MQEFKKNLIDLVAKYGFACGDLIIATNRRARDMGREVIECRAKCDELRAQITKEVNKITAIESGKKFTYKAVVYGPSFVIDEFDIEGNRESVVHLKAGMSFAKANEEFQSRVGIEIHDVEKVNTICCNSSKEGWSYISTRNNKSGLWVVTDRQGMVLDIFDLT